jgi:hypothetical protein
MKIHIHSVTNTLKCDSQVVDSENVGYRSFIIVLSDIPTPQRKFIISQETDVVVKPFSIRVDIPGVTGTWKISSHPRWRMQD